MSPKTIAYLAVIFSGLLVLALGGWLVKGVQGLTGQTRQSDLRPRYA